MPGSLLDSGSRFYPGQIVFDLKRSDPTDDLLVVVDPNVGKVFEQPEPTHSYIVNNDANKEIGFTDETQCVAAAYITDEAVEVGTDVYTFPATRLETVSSLDVSALDGFHPYQWALSHFLGELISVMERDDMTIQSIDDFEILCMKASVDGEVIRNGAELGRAHADSV